MNVENIKRVRDHIAALPADQFNMRRFTSECGTAHCIAGWAGVLFGTPGEFHGSSFGREALGLDEETALDLFYCGDGAEGDEAWNSTPQQAVRVLDHLIATGEVDWSVAAEVAP